ncbi:hypothetical protein N8955_00135 [bacterium]|nr:hypothetical protein [bacterium]
MKSNKEIIFYYSIIGLAIAFILYSAFTNCSWDYSCEIPLYIDDVPTNPIIPTIG